MKEYYVLKQALKMDRELYKETIYSGYEYLDAVERATFNHLWFSINVFPKDKADQKVFAYKWNIGIWGWN